jgi:hypothetical protein
MILGVCKNVLNELIIFSHTKYMLKMFFFKFTLAFIKRA